jgi:hypothetical protein
LNRDTIAEIEIAADGKLHVVPATHTFPLIYREAMEVHWDTVGQSLYSPKPREWSYSQWLQQILAAAREQGIELGFAPTTKWLNIQPSLKAELLLAGGKAA